MGAFNSCSSSKDLNNDLINIPDNYVNNKKNILNIPNISNNIEEKDLINFKTASRFQTKSGYYYVHSVYDGDTFTILIPLIFKSFSCYKNSDKDKLKVSVNKDSCTDSDDILFYKVNIRLHGIDAYEIKPRKNIENREEHVRKAYAGKEYLKELILNKFIFIEFTKHNDPYARPIAIPFYEKDNKRHNISDMMIKNGHAVSYDGGKKTL
jgi:endonuclease YncB( thermonuclease family)